MKHLLLLLVFFLFKISFAQTAPIVFVSGDGTGDFNCDGTNDQIEINQALDYVATHNDFTTVYLKGTNIYWIDEPMYISSNTILEGDSLAVIKLIDNANWETMFKSLIMQKGATFNADLEDTTVLTENITIRGFEIDGNRQNQEEPSGHSYYNMIKLQHCTNITISNMYLHDNLADVVNIQSTAYGHDINLKFFNNRVHASGHDGIYIGRSTNFEIYNNNFTNNRTDAHIRAQDCNHFKIHDNACGNHPDGRNSGGIGIDIQASYNAIINDCEIYNNFLYGKSAFHGIWLWQKSRGGYLDSHRDVHIHHNIIVGYQASGIGIFGFHNTLIENNVIEYNGEGNNKSYTDNVLVGKQSGITFYKGGNKNKMKGFKTIVRNNIIGNSAGYGIEDKKPNIHTFIVENNCIYNNLKGKYKNVSSFTDIYTFPDYIGEDYTVKEGRYNYALNILSKAWGIAEESGVYSGNLDVDKAKNVYHLKSEYGRWNGMVWVNDSITSYCINQGKSSSIYGNEPIPNGSRVNIGAFGNTVEASKSNIIANLNHFTVYPNPTTGFITVSDEFNNSYFEVYAVTGQIVQKGYVNTLKIDLSQLSQGMYVVKIKEHGLEQMRTVKVIKVD